MRSGDCVRVRVMVMVMGMVMVRVRVRVRVRVVSSRGSLSNAVGRLCLG